MLLSAWAVLTRITSTVVAPELVPHVDNVYTVITVVCTGLFHWLVARAHSRKLLTIKLLVNGRMSERDLRVEQLTHELSKAGIPIPPPAQPVVRTIVVREDKKDGA